METTKINYHDKIQLQNLNMTVKPQTVQLLRLKKIFYIFVFILALSCTARVFLVPFAQAASDPFDESQEYTSDSRTTYNDDDESGSGSKKDDAIQVSFTKPDEAQSRIDEEEYPLVPGAEKILALEKQNTKQVLASQESSSIKKNTNTKRKIASINDEDVVRVVGEDSTKGTPVDIDFKSKQISKSVQNELSPKKYNQEGLNKDEPLDTKSAESLAPKGQYQEVSVIVSDIGFFPNRIFVTEGIPVKLYLSTPSKTTLCFINDQWGVQKGVAPGKVEEVEFTPTTPGNFRFYCPIKGLEGVMTVRSLSTTLSALK
jgi:hypothetical protein